MIRFAIDNPLYLLGNLPIPGLMINTLLGVRRAARVMPGPGFVTLDNAALVMDVGAMGTR
jgi:hypothetical protein